jgi:hypothetical protein
MKHLLISALLMTVALPGFAETKCEDAVDMADSLDFHAMHVECSNDPVTIYEPKSSRDKNVVTTYDKSEPVAPVNKKSAVVEQSLSSPTSVKAAATKVIVGETAGKIFNIREPFTLTGGPQSALNGLFVQMAKLCPTGWSKEREWVEPAPAGFYLHYQFQCAE